MAKRFTDTEKWKDPWFDNLTPVGKVFFYYLIDMVDNAGIWKTNFEHFKRNFGFKYTKNEFEAEFDTKITKLSNGNYHLKNFIKFQYGELRNGSNITKGIAKTLEYNGLQVNSYLRLEVEYGKTMPTLQDKDKDKDKDKDNINIYLSNTILTKTKSSQEGIDYTHPLDLPCDPPLKTKEKKFKPDLEALYKLYPRKEGKKKALERLSKIITDAEKFTQVETAIKNYASLCSDKETQFIKLFSSFVSVWEDYLTLPEKKLCDFTEDEALAYFEQKMSTPGKFGFGRDHV